MSFAYGVVLAAAYPNDNGAHLGPSDTLYCPRRYYTSIVKPERHIFGTKPVVYLGFAWDEF
jgi:hypothetical protein